MRAANIARRGDELVVMLTLGEQLAPDRLADLLEHHDFAQGSNPSKPAIADLLRNARNQPSYIEATQLLDTIAMVRFNLRERRMEARVLLRDMTESFRTWTDSHQALSSAFEEDSAAFRNMVAELDACDAVWEVAKTLTLFPAYLGARVRWAQERRQTTELGAVLPKSLKKRRALAAVATKDRVLFRTISAIPYVAQENASPLRLEGRSYTAPAFQVAVEGFWRKLSNPQAKGKGPANEEVVGQTWVRSHIRHKDKAPPELQRVVYIKASLSEARARLEKFRRRAAGQTPAAELASFDKELPASQTSAPSAVERPGQPGAYVYVMRCHAHAENLYKVGFTDRDPETRAKELSAVTSAPLPFVVMQAWAVSDGHAAERHAHAVLASVRLSESREFFNLPYEQLRAQVEAAVGTWALPN